jgi:hypothetical protein
MKIFAIDLFFFRHLIFPILTLKLFLSKQHIVKGKFKLLKFFYVKYLVNYIESLKYYLYEKKNFDFIISDKKFYEIENHGLQFLDKIDLNSIKFINFNNNIKKNKFLEFNEINFNLGEKFAKNHGFHFLAKKYLSTPKCNLLISSWNTYGCTDKYQIKTNLWHRDRDGIKVLKFFIYLTDVNENCGQHLYILGSHKKKPLRFVPQFRFENKTIEKYFNNKNIINVFGDKGTCFMEDTTGLHRGTNPLLGNSRSILVYTYFTGPVLENDRCLEVNLD